MRIRIIISIVLLIGVIHCKKTENEVVEGKITFIAGKDNSDIIVNYSDIIEYDSTKFIFRIKESSWKRLQSKIAPVYPDPHFDFSVTLDKQIIYTTHFIPGYYSTYFDDITFSLSEPDLVNIKLGYPSQEFFTGEDLRNDLRLLTQLESDNKIIEIGE